MGPFCWNKTEFAFGIRERYQRHEDTPMLNVTPGSPPNAVLMVVRGSSASSEL